MGPIKIDTRNTGQANRAEGRQAAPEPAPEPGLPTTAQSPASLFRAGVDASHQGEALQALEYFEAALSASASLAEGAGGSEWPGQAALHNARGNSLFLLDLNQGALDSYSRAIRLDARYVAPHMGRGHVFRFLGMLPEALAAYEAALALEPDNALAHYGRGHVLRDLGRLPAALAAYECAFSLNPDAPATYYGKATLTY